MGWRDMLPGEIVLPELKPELEWVRGRAPKSESDLSSLRDCNGHSLRLLRVGRRTAVMGVSEPNGASAFGR